MGNTLRWLMLALALVCLPMGLVVGCSGQDPNQETGPVEGSDPALDEDPGAGTETTNP